MKKLLLVSTALLGVVAASQAGVDVHFGFHLPLPIPGAVIISRPAPPPYVVQQPVYAPPACAPALVYAPAPYCAPPAVVVAPAPYYCPPAPVIVARRPVYYASRAFEGYPGHYRHHHW